MTAFGNKNRTKWDNLGTYLTQFLRVTTRQQRENLVPRFFLMTPTDNAPTADHRPHLLILSTISCTINLATFYVLQHWSLHKKWNRHRFKYLVLRLWCAPRPKCDTCRFFVDHGRDVKMMSHQKRQQFRRSTRIQETWWTDLPQGKSLMTVMHLKYLLHSSSWCCIRPERLMEVCVGVRRNLASFKATTNIHIRESVAHGHEDHIHHSRYQTRNQ
jgi:hypothetical protein